MTTPAERLRDAANLLHRDGWTQNRMIDPRNGARCALGAICDVKLDHPQDTVHAPSPDSPEWPLYLQTITALATSILDSLPAADLPEFIVATRTGAQDIPDPFLPTFFYQGIELYVASVIARYNDVVASSPDEVTALMEKTAARLEEVDGL